MIASTRVFVSPASGRRESLAALLLVLAILALSSTVVLLHRQAGEETVLPQGQVDLRSGLNAAEQGLTADLLTAATEIPHLDDPTPHGLAAEGLPPFTIDATSAARGRHDWQLIESHGLRGWLGRPAAPEVARTLLLRLDGETPTVWLANEKTAPADLRDDQLIAAGWLQVMTRYDASVTRRDAH